MREKKHVPQSKWVIICMKHVLTFLLTSKQTIDLCNDYYNKMRANSQNYAAAIMSKCYFS